MTQRLHHQSRDAEDRDKKVEAVPVRLEVLGYPETQQLEGGFNRVD